MQAPVKSVIITLPTYNEADNIEALCREIFRLYPEIAILVIDDDSPDGTWQIVRDLQKEYAGLYLLHRQDQKGRGTAGRDGFLKAVELGAQHVIEMDADFSHHPAQISSLLEKADDKTVVIGSRLIKGGAEAGRKKSRRWITLAANWYIRRVLKLTIKDCTSGFRVFPRNILEKIDFASFRSTGPEIVQEMLYHCVNAGASFKEVPILFKERAAGHSTFNSRIMLRSLIFIIYLRFFYKITALKKKE